MGIPNLTFEQRKEMSDKIRSYFIKKYPDLAITDDITNLLYNHAVDDCLDFIKVLEGHNFMYCAVLQDLRNQISDLKLVD